MEAPVLTDPAQVPTEAVISSHLGARRALWDALFGFIHAEHPDFSERWRYYNDGKSWLLNVSWKKKTIFWLAIVPGTFRITAYFTEKAADLIRESALSTPLKEQFASGKAVGKLRGLTITFRQKRDVEDARTLIALKQGAGSRGTGAQEQSRGTGAQGQRGKGQRGKGQRGKGQRGKGQS